MLIAEVAGSFGTLQYPLMALTAPNDSERDEPSGTPRPLGTDDLLRRGFRLARSPDYADIALKAQPADGSVACRLTAGLLSLVVDGEIVWSERLDQENEEHALWIEAARTRAVTLIRGDQVQISHSGIDPTGAARNRTLVMAKIPTEWILPT